MPIGGPDWSASGTVYVAKTTDGGLTWTPKLFDGTTGYMRGLECTTDDKCWMVGRYARIYRTTNGGVNWTQLGSNGYVGWTYSVANTMNGDGTVVGLTCGSTTTNPDDPGFLQSDNGVNFTNAYAPNCAVKYDIICPSSGGVFLGCTPRPRLQVVRQRQELECPQHGHRPNPPGHRLREPVRLLGRRRHGAHLEVDGPLGDLGGSSPACPAA